MSTKAFACNLAMSRLGNYGSIENIDTPIKPTEIVFAKWWEHSKEVALKTIKPNFALERVKLAKDATAPAFGYSTRFAKPADCLAVLGFGQVQEKRKEYAIEGGWILTEDYDTDTDGNITLSLRYVKNVDDVSAFDPEFMEELSWFLAYNANMEITQDDEKQVYLEKVINSKKAEAAALASQENPPIRINKSKFIQARTATNPKNYDKR